MTETTTELKPLTKNDIHALKKATSVAFFHQPQDGGLIRAIKRVADPKPLEARELTHEIPVRTQLRGKHADGTPCEPDNTSCFEMVNSSQYCEVWRTVAAFVRPGDLLALEWQANGGANQYVEQAVTQLEGSHGMRLFCDRLELRIYRKVRGTTESFAFNMSESTCPDNSARMVRRAF